MRSVRVGAKDPLAARAHHPSCKFMATATALDSKSNASVVKSAWTLASQFKFACIVVPAWVFYGEQDTRELRPAWAGPEEIRNLLSGLLSGTKLSRCGHFFSVSFAYQGSRLIIA